MPKTASWHLDASLLKRSLHATMWHCHLCISHRNKTTSPSPHRNKFSPATLILQKGILHKTMNLRWCVHATYPAYNSSQVFQPSRSDVSTLSHRRQAMIRPGGSVLHSFLMLPLHALAATQDASRFSDEAAATRRLPRTDPRHCSVIKAWHGSGSMLIRVL